MSTIAYVFSFLIVFSLSSPPDSHLPLSQVLCALFFSHKKPTPSFHPQFSLPLSHLSLSFSLSLSLSKNAIGVHRVARSALWVTAWRDQRVAWSRWWRCGFESRIDGGNVGRSQWWFNMSLWCRLVLVCVSLLGLG